MWTAVIVLQVALTVAFLPLAVSQSELAFVREADSGFPADAVITAQLGHDPIVPPRTTEERAAYLRDASILFEDVRAAVAADPSVRSAALASGLSAMNHLQVPVELAADDGGEPIAGRARVLLVDRHYLDLVGASTVAGQPLAAADFNAEAAAVVVNERFVSTYLGGRNPVGGTLRFVERRGESSGVGVPRTGTAVQVIGVVRDPGIDQFGPGAHPAIYAPLDLAPVSPREAGSVGMPQAPVTQLFVHLGPGTTASAGRLYSLVGAIDPNLRLSEVGTAAEVWAPVHMSERLGGWIFITVAAIVLMLSIAGIYALMSFTVSRRSREIAIRTAVGASQGRIVRHIFARSVLQLLIGVALGSLIAVPVLLRGVAVEGPRSLIIVASLLLVAGTAACLWPVRRALAIDPATTMKAE